MNCIYCDNLLNNSNKTNEHVIPQWIIKKLGIKNQKLSFLLVSEESEKLALRNPVTNTLTHNICNTCNNTWLNEIDNSCTELLNMMIENKQPNNHFSKSNILKLQTLIYKIFLNFFATGTIRMREKKRHFFKDFYKTKLPPEFVNLFLLNARDPMDQPFIISHLDQWITHSEGPLFSENIGFVFKFYLQLGKITFILCSAGQKDKRILYKNGLLLPIIAHKSTKAIEINDFISCESPTQDNFPNRVLFNFIIIEQLN